jgi:hypothetical protein
MGRDARVMSGHDGTFVFADSVPLPFISGAANEFAVRASGGVRMVTAIDGLGVPSAGTFLAAGSGSWSSFSDSGSKADIQNIDAATILTRLESMPIHTWRYKSQDESIRHLGPMAQDFSAAFGVGDDPRYITSVDADGVALAAIQELARQLRAESEEKDRRISALEAVLSSLREQLDLIEGMSALEK